KYKKRPEEKPLLKKVINAGVKNIAEYYYYKIVYNKSAAVNTCNSLREGLNSITRKRNILYRDILAGNIILKKDKDNSFLINLNLTIKVNRKKVLGALSKTGTKVFIAISAFYSKYYNFIYNLELFF
ncbi:uncharacterized protein BDZ99DRAFT_388347, partial [Mytilinidion resinicola]